MSNLLGDIAFYRTYAALKENGTKENRQEVAQRTEDFLVSQFRPAEEARIRDAMQYVKDNKAVTSMRLMQFAGNAVRKENLRAYNCSFVNITTVKDLQDILYLSSCGVGCGFSVKRWHVEQLPVITVQNPSFDMLFVIGDSRESWADSIGTLFSDPYATFDYSQIRPAGTPLSSGGAASGPEPLMQCHETIRAILLDAIGRKLRPIEVHSIACSIGHCIVSGGVRRSAMISLFDKDDEEMLASKSMFPIEILKSETVEENDIFTVKRIKDGSIGTILQHVRITEQYGAPTVGGWWVFDPHFARANNSAHCLRGDTSEAEFNRIFDACIASQAGEPGIAWTNDLEIGGNPCFEIALKSRQLCNLTEVIVSNCADEEDFRKAVMAATILGTYQAALTDFNYVHPDWSKNCKEDALLGVSLTGQAQKWELLNTPDLAKLARFMKEVNAKVAADIGINRAARIGTVKPSGSTSTAMGCSSGIHAVHAPFYYRRIRINKMDPLATFLLSVLPEQFVEHSPYEPNDVIFGVPMKMNGINRHTETSIQLLERMKYIANNWIVPSHFKGLNTHNVSLTVSYKTEEVQEIKDWMWFNRSEYNGISLLPFSDATYSYAPFEDITEDRYNELIALLPNIDLSTVIYRTQDDTRADTSGCEGGLCEIPKKA